MQAYDDAGKLFATMQGGIEELTKERDKLISSGKASKVDIGILPKIGQEVSIDNLSYEVTNVNEFGKVIMMLKRPRN